jgi:hypothetical protein
MINEADQNEGNTDRSKARRKQLRSNTYGYDDEDDYMDNGPDANPYEVRNYD